MFFESCGGIANLFVKKIRKASPSRIIGEIKKDKSVLILVHYGSSARKEEDELSDVDLLIVTRDRISRGEIISRFSGKKMDLNVYSKSGFLKLLKTQPDFIAHVSTAKVLKGKDILEAVIIQK